MMRLIVPALIVVVLWLLFYNVNTFKTQGTSKKTEKQKNQLFDTAQEKWNNKLGQPLHLECDTKNGEGIFEVRSEFHGNERDRQYRWQCHTVATEPMIDCFWSNEINDYQGSMLYMCQTNFVVAGISSTYDRKKQDRKWKVKCCRANSHFTRACKISDSINKFGKPFFYTAANECSDPGVMVGLASEINREKLKDREWRVVQCSYANRDSCKYKCNSVRSRGTKKKHEKRHKKGKKHIRSKEESSPVKTEPKHNEHLGKIATHNRRRRSRHHDSDLDSIAESRKHHHHHHHSRFFDQKESSHSTHSKKHKDINHYTTKKEKAKKHFDVEESHHHKHHKKHHHHKELADMIEAAPSREKKGQSISTRTQQPSSPRPKNTPSSVNHILLTNQFPNSGYLPSPITYNPVSPLVLGNYLQRKASLQPTLSITTQPANVSPIKSPHSKNSKAGKNVNGRPTPVPAAQEPVHNPVDPFQQLLHLAQLSQPVLEVTQHLHYYVPVKDDGQDHSHIKYLKHLQGLPGVEIHHHIPAESQPRNGAGANDYFKNVRDDQRNQNQPTHVHIYLSENENKEKTHQKDVTKRLQHLMESLPKNSEIHYHLSPKPSTASPSAKRDNSNKQHIEDLLSKIPKNAEVHYHMSPLGASGHQSKTPEDYSLQDITNYRPLLKSVSLPSAPTPKHESGENYEEKYKELVEKLKELFPMTESRDGDSRQDLLGTFRKYSRK